jgi:hypothetical protein
MKSYLSVLNEDKNSSVAADNTGELDGAENAKKFQKNSGPESVKEVEKPVKGPHSEQEADSLPKAVNSESKNPFDLIYNKILAQEAFGEEGEGDTLDFSGNIDGSDDLGMEDDMGEEEMGEDEMGEEGEEESEEVTLQTVLDHLKSAVEALEALTAHEEEEEGEEEMGEEEMGEEDFGDDLGDDLGDEDLGESVDAEIEGHALVNQPKLEKGMTKQKIAKGAVPVSKKKGQVVKGAKATGKPEAFKVNPQTLTNKAKQNTGGVKVGKGLFDQ